MLESEPCGLDSPLVIENYIKRILLSTNTIFLAALAIDLDLREHSHLLIKGQHGGERCIAVIGLYSANSQEVPEWGNPRVNRALDGVVESSQRSIDLLHGNQVVLVAVVHIVKDHVPWWTCVTVSVKSLKVVKNVRMSHEGNVLVQASKELLA